MLSFSIIEIFGAAIDSLKPQPVHLFNEQRPVAGIAADRLILFKYEFFMSMDDLASHEWL
jgi:hypothetical protein